MALDLHTLTLLLPLHLLALAAVLPVLTGWRGSPALRWAQASLWALVGGWVFLLLGEQVAPVFGLTLSYFLIGLSLVLCLRALQGWLGGRPGMRWAWALLALEPPLLLLGAEQPLIRQGAANAWLALLQALLLLGLAWRTPRAPETSPRWRAVMALPLALLFGMTLWRAGTGLLEPTLYPSLRGDSLFARSYLLVAFVGASLGALAYLAAWRGEAEGRLRHQAKTDSLTQLANRRAFDQRGNEMIAVARRHREPLAVMLLDVDHFSQVNNLHGHARADEALGLLARLLRAAVRPGDCAARLSGEEFAVLLNRSEREGAEALDRRLRSSLAEHAERELGFPLDYSAGWALLRPGDRHVEDMLRRADAGLYTAKHGGRGRLCAEPGLLPEDP